MRTFGREWYEYIWPRDPWLMFARPKVISPRLVKQVRFSFDSQGIVPQDSCIFLGLQSEVGGHVSAFRKKLGAALHRNAGSTDILCYCLGFLNSDDAQRRLVAGRRPTPKGFYAITEDYLREVPIPFPDPRTARSVVGFVNLEKPSKLNAVLE
jgi:hypothetical protein